MRLSSRAFDELAFALMQLRERREEIQAEYETKLMDLQRKIASVEQTIELLEAERQQHDEPSGTFGMEVKYRDG